MLIPENLSASGKSIRKSDSQEITWSLKGTDDEFEIVLAPYSGVDFSKQAFMFCGQGAMAPGGFTGGLDEHPVFQKRFRELDEIATALNAGTPSEYLKQPNVQMSPEQESVYSGLSLYAIQVAMFEAVLMTGQIPKVMTAHSFGEFAQLTASGVISFAEMVRFLIDRQRCLTEFKGQYTMFAVSHPEPVDLSQFHFEIYPANYNTRFQTTFVCREVDFTEVKAAFRAQRLASVKMNIDFPYHTPWLSPVRDRLKEILSDRNFTLSSPKIPIVSSVTHKVVDAANFSPELIRQILLDQLVTPVRFQDQIEEIRKRGIYNFFEISPVDVLGDFVAQFFEGSKEPFKISSFRKNFKAAASSAKSYDRFKDSKFFGKLDSALKAMTGYSIQGIRLEDRIREDLGIDSIKKAEIVFEIVDSMAGESIVTPANLADLATFGDIVEYFETSRVAAQSLEKSGSEDKQTVFEARKRGWRPERLVDFTAFKDLPVRRVALSDVRSGIVDLDAAPDEILLLDARAYSAREGYLADIKWWLDYLRDCEKFGQGVVLIHKGELWVEGFSGIMNSLSKERHFSFKMIELADRANLTDREANRERADFFQSRVRYSDGQRWIREFKTEPLSARWEQPKKVLAFGGMGGVCHFLLTGFASGSLSSLVVVGRTPFDQLSSEKLAQLESLGSHVEYISVDVSEPGVAEREIQKLHDQFRGFDLIIHGVGVEISEPLDRIRDQDIDLILEGKVRLAEALHKYGELHPQTKIIFNSSIVSEFGSSGQCAYGAANSYLNELADQSKNIVSIMWPGWDGIGVAAQTINAKSLKLQGLTLMQPKNGQEVFLASMGATPGTLAVLGRGVMAQFGQNRAEYSWLMKPASRDYSLFVVPGLTQEKLPYLKDHLVKRACIFPGSGSISLMLFRAYLERGELGNIKNFAAQNFYVVREDTSNVTIEVSAKTESQMAFQVKAHQVLATGDVVFGDFPAPDREFHFQCDKRGEGDYDHNVSVYTGPKFELARESFINTETGGLVLDIDFEKAPTYFPIPFIDKVHRMVELCFNTSYAKGLMEFEKFSVPKSIESIEFIKANMEGHRFYSLIEKIEWIDGLFYCDVTLLNEKAKPAVVVKGLWSIVVGDSKSATTKGYRITELNKTLF